MIVFYRLGCRCLMSKDFVLRLIEVFFKDGRWRDGSNRDGLTMPG